MRTPNGRLTSDVTRAFVRTACYNGAVLLSPCLPQESPFRRAELESKVRSIAATLNNAPLRNRPNATFSFFAFFLVLVRFLD